MHKLILKQRAVIMTREAYVWYETQLNGLGESFITELDTCFKRIVKNPTFFGYIQNGFRSLTLKRFPYIIIYEVTEKQIIVFAVFHSYKDPLKRLI